MSSVVKNLQVGSAEWVQTYGLSAIDTCRRAQLDAALEDERIFSVEGDLGDCGGDDFKAMFPRRFIDLGIAEANMIGVSAGLAMRGKIPFVNTFATFALMRACEQIRVDVCYHNANVKFAGIFGGVGAGFSGPTHHSIEDVAIARSFPNMVVISPADAVSAYHATIAAAKHPGPVYIRLGCDATAQVYGEECPFEIGKGIVLRDGNDVTIIASGLSMVANAVAAADLLKADAISARVIDMHTIKPIDAELIVRAAKETGLIVTVEEHSIIGGLGGAVAEVLGEQYPAPMRILGIPDAHCKELAPYSEHLRRYGLDAASIAASVRQTLERRR